MTELISPTTNGATIDGGPDRAQEALSAFEARLDRDHIAFDLEDLVVEFLGNANEGVEGLDEETYRYLEKAGISRATVKQLEADLVTHEGVARYLAGAPRKPEMLDAERKSEELWTFWDIAGNPDDLMAALNWADGGGYGWLKRRRFVSVLHGDDFEAKADAVRRLMDAYRLANPPINQAA